MNIETLVKKLKDIEPDSTYTRRSRRMILMSERRGTPSLTFSRIIMNSIQIGSSIVLTGLLIIFVLGGFSAERVLTPFRLSSLDPQNLRAEADAIDIQIELLTPSYSELPPLLSETTTIETTKPVTLPDLKKERGEEGTAASELSIDEALRVLSE